jgi:hypothetical protein
MASTLGFIGTSFRLKHEPFHVSCVLANAIPLKKWPVPAKGLAISLYQVSSLRWHYPDQVQRVGDKPVVFSAGRIPAPRIPTSERSTKNIGQGEWEVKV